MGPLLVTFLGHYNLLIKNTFMKLTFLEIYLRDINFRMYLLLWMHFWTYFICIYFRLSLIISPGLISYQLLQAFIMLKMGQEDTISQ